MWANIRLATITLSLFVVIGFSPAARAWDGTPSGTITIIDVTTDSYSFRVNLTGAPAMCGNANTWAYLSSADPNYSAFAAALLSAKAMGNAVVLYTTRDASGYCHVGYVSLH